MLFNLSYATLDVLHRETELYVLQESAIRLLLIVNVHTFYKAVEKFFLLQIDELIV